VSPGEEVVIAIVNPPNPPEAVSNKDTMGGLGQLYPLGTKHSMQPLDIPYTAAVLRDKGVPVDVLDCLGCDWELSELILRLQDQKPGLVAIRTSTPTFDWDMRVARIIKMVTNSKIVVFGPHVTLFPRQVIRQTFVDAIVLGEPELTFLDIAERGLFSGCKGVWHKEGGDIARNGTREPIENLDQLPFPAWDSMPYQAYEGGALMRNLAPFVTALTSRGCPHGCAYCPYPVIQGRKLRVRSPENVVDELEWLANGLGVRAVLFRDPEFALHRDRVVGICEGILERKVRLAWRCETRMEDLDEELIALMAKAGCIGINMGVESADEQVLRNVKRRAIPSEQAAKAVRACKKNGIEAFCFFILGLPGETRESALRTIDYALKLNPAFVQFTVATPYPGTELRAWAESKGFIENDTPTAMTSYEVAMRNEHMTADEIRWLWWFAHEALEMQGYKAARRVLGNARRAVSEIGRWLRFQGARRHNETGRGKE
jgi:anaerobic magnesium-protoporphyrin IX monomethyl ester cyclase